MLELRWNKEPKVAMNVFEVGLKRFPDEVEFVLHYLDFLITTNDEGSTSLTHLRFTYRGMLTQAHRRTSRVREDSI